MFLPRINVRILAILPLFSEGELSLDNRSDSEVIIFLNFLRTGKVCSEFSKNHNNEIQQQEFTVRNL